MVIRTCPEYKFILFLNNALIYSDNSLGSFMM